jgi:probable HAF family extracellular repeat protein
MAESMGAASGANGLNDQGQVVGFSEIEPGSTAFRAFLWTQGVGMVDLGTLGGAFASAFNINHRREVTGFSENENGNTRAFLWRPGQGTRGLGTRGLF